MSDTKSSGGISFLGALGVLFIGLKLMGFINWSWWYVTMPLWFGLAIFVIFFSIIGIIISIGKLLK